MPGLPPSTLRQSWWRRAVPSVELMIDTATGPRVTRVLLACGALGSPLFLVVFHVDAAIRPGYELGWVWAALVPARLMATVRQVEEVRTWAR